MYNTVTLCTFTLLCSYYNCATPELFHANWIPCMCNSSLFITAYSQPRLIFFLPLWIWLFYVCQVSGIIEYLSFTVWLILLCIMFWRFICVVVSEFYLCLKLNSIPHLFTDQWAFGLFPTIVTHAAMSIGIPGI